MSENAQTSGLPVTTSVARHVTDGHEQEFVAWTDAGIAVVRTFPGFLGGGWLRSASDPDEYHVLYRFASEETLHDWLASPLRKAWVVRGDGVSVDHSTHRLTGIEGWFEPQSNLTNAVRVMGSPPPRWKQAVTIWIAFFPLSLILNLLVAPYISNVLLRTLALTLINTPLMVYIFLPFITARLSGWLQPGR